MSLPLKKTEKYTYKDYLNWNDDERWELIDGVPYNMSPAPNRFHQEIVGNLHLKFASFLEGKPCRVYIAPFDVRLPLYGENDDEIENVVQPDLLVVCDRSKLDDRGCKGAPDLVIEVISPSTGKKDLYEKFGLYEKSGVKEYWVVYPNDKTIMVYKRNDENKYDDGTEYTIKKEIKPELLEGFTLVLEDIFKD